MSKDINFEKPVLDESNFDQMNWHDSKIYAFAFMDETFELLFDIDYILEWLHPKGDDVNFKFWIAPSTLVFRNVWDVKVSLESGLDLEILSVRRANPHTPRNVKHVKETVEYDWLIETNSGDVTFKSVGYIQYFRKAPLLTELQRIDLLDRGGISFDRGGNSN